MAQDDLRSFLRGDLLSACLLDCPARTDLRGSGCRDLTLAASRLHNYISLYVFADSLVLEQRLYELYSGFIKCISSASGTVEGEATT